MANNKTDDFNIAPLGLLGFGLTTILLNIHNAGFYPLNSMIIAMGIFYGGISQIIAGIIESRRKNLFATVAFTSYGAFWLSLVTIWLLPELNIAKAPDTTAMGCYLAMWGMLSIIFFIGTLNGATIGKLVFGSLVILFALLTLANFLNSPTIHIIAGYEGILCGLFAFYEASAIIINEKYSKNILPM